MVPGNQATASEIRFAASAPRRRTWPIKLSRWVARACGLRGLGLRLWMLTRVLGMERSLASLSFMGYDIGLRRLFLLGG